MEDEKIVKKIKKSAESKLQEINQKMKELKKYKKELKKKEEEQKLKRITKEIKVKKYSEENIQKLITMIKDFNMSLETKKEENKNKKRRK